ncbi:MAG: hypothetical protein K2J71_00125 [Oscillospiraceae bacterium]|nr:hypothetical protein [Oscillospiraceae bacterium]
MDSFFSQIPGFIWEILRIIVTIAIAAVSGIYAVSTNTKKYELTENYRCEIMSWHKSVVQIMIKIIHSCESGTFYLESFSKEREELLSSLSTLAEIGRFYFPNVIKNDSFGKKKPSAYQGYRHIVLEFVLHFYFKALHSDSSHSSRDICSMWKFEREFTSFIFDMLSPRTRSKEYSKYLSITIPDGKSMEDFISDSPHNFETFYYV